MQTVQKKGHTRDIPGQDSMLKGASRTGQQGNLSRTWHNMSGSREGGEKKVALDVATHINPPAAGIAANGTARTPASRKSATILHVTLWEKTLEKTAKTRCHHPSSSEDARCKSQKARSLLLPLNTSLVKMCLCDWSCHNHNYVMLDLWGLGRWHCSLPRLEACHLSSRERPTLHRIVERQASS